MLCVVNDYYYTLLFFEYSHQSQPTTLVIYENEYVYRLILYKDMQKLKMYMGGELKHMPKCMV
jgi:hypothetical protein